MRWVSLTLAKTPPDSARFRGRSRAMIFSSEASVTCSSTCCTDARDVLALRIRGEAPKLRADFRDSDIGRYLAIVGDAIMALQSFRVNRLAEGREAQHLAFVAQAAKPEDLRGLRVKRAKTVGAVGLAIAARIRLAAEQILELSAEKPTRAVIDAIAPAVGGVDQRIVVVGVKQRRERMREMMIVERYRPWPKAVVGEISPRVERPRGIADPLARHHAHEFVDFRVRQRRRPARARV